MDRRIPSHRPQHERQTLAPRRWSSPPTHRGPPQRRNTWARHSDSAPFSRGDSRRRRYDASQVGRLPPAPTSPRREVLTIGRREGRAPTSTPQPERPVAPSTSQEPARQVLTENQRKRERRRRNRHALYRELEELVLKHTQVRIRADGEISQENGRITFRISPTLETDERYQYLLKRLTPKPRKIRDETAGKEVVSTQELPLTNLKRKGSREATPSIASSEDLSDSTSASATPMEGVEKLPPTQGGEAFSQAQTHDAGALPTSEVPKEDMAMCAALTARSKGKSKVTWVPPPVTHDFTYPSDEEIQVNPRASFTSAPCLPVTERRNALSEGDQAMASDISPRRYDDIASRLPRDSEEMQHLADRAGASTRLKSIAEQKLKQTMTNEEKEFSGPYTDDSDSDSSASLEVHSAVPLFGDLAHSIPSDGECPIDNLNTVPARVAGEGSGKGVSLEEQV